MSETNRVPEQESAPVGFQPGMKELYHFLSCSMRYPARDWLNSDYYAALYSILDGLAWQSEHADLREAVSSDPDPLETIQVEHTRLFINAAPHVVAPPYGSVYMPGEGTIMNRSTELVSAFYRQHGFALAPGSEIADHLVCELEFLGLLAGSGKAEDEDVFLQRFFRPWFGVFQNRVIEGCEHPFYRVQVRLIDFFTKEEV